MKGALTTRGKVTTLCIFITMIYMMRVALTKCDKISIVDDENHAYMMDTSRLVDDGSLRGQLGYYFGYDKYSAMPRNVFQTWKHSRRDDKFPREFRGSVDSWHDKNVDDGFRHFVFTDDVLDEWVSVEFANVPDVVKAWKLLPKMILKADLFRYLVVFARGGVYSDIDTVCLKSIASWPGVESGIGLAVGIEADPDRVDWHEWYARRIQFVQWTIMGKKGHPFLRELIARVVEETLRKNEMGMLRKIEGKDAGGDVMSWTGPGIFTDTLFDYLNNVDSNGEYGDGYGIGSSYWINGEKYLLKKQEIDEIDGMPINAKHMSISYKKFTGLREPIEFFNDIMILPITCFSPGVGQMGSKAPSDKLALVLHNFNGSWKPESEKMNG